VELLWGCSEVGDEAIGKRYVSLLTTIRKQLRALQSLFPPRRAANYGEAVKLTLFGILSFCVTGKCCACAPPAAYLLFLGLSSVASPTHIGSFLWQRGPRKGLAWRYTGWIPVQLTLL
jgi:hypothetical protein